MRMEPSHIRKHRVPSEDRNHKNEGIANDIIQSSLEEIEGVLSGTVKRPRQEGSVSDFQRTSTAI